MTTQSPTPVSTERLEELRHACAQTGICSDNGDGCSCADAELLSRSYRDEAKSYELRADDAGRLAKRLGEAADTIDLLALRSPLQDSQELVERRCRKPGCGAREIIGHPCTDWDCPQHFVSAKDYRTALSAPSPRIVKLEARIAELEAGHAQHTIAMMNKHRLQHDEILRLTVALSTAEARGLERAAKLIDDGFSRPVGEPYAKNGSRSKNDKCPHGRYMYEDCEPCCAAAIRALSTNEAGE